VKYTVETPHGTVTRTTERTYTHVVTAAGPLLVEILAEQERQRAGHLESAIVMARAIEGTAPYPEWMAGMAPKDRADRAKANAKYHAEVVGVIDTRLERLRAQLEAEGPKARGKLFVRGWCGRPDLAAKLVSQSIRQGFKPEQLAVTPTTQGDK
jgi:hypothetical protein